MPICYRIVALVAGLFFSAASVAATNSEQNSQAGTFESALEFFEAGRAEIAARQLKQLLSDDPDNLQARLLLGDVYLELGYAAASESQLRHALRNGASIEFVAVKLAKSLYLQRKFEAMVEEFHAVGHKSRVRVELLVTRALAFIELRRFDEAEREISEAMEIAPLEVGPVLAQVQLNVYRGRLDEAQRGAARATELHPEAAQAWYLRGIVENYLGQNATALGYFTRALEVTPRHIPARTARANLYVAANRWDDARADVEFVRQHATQDAHAAYVDARIKRAEGDAEGAEQALIEAAGILQELGQEYIRGNIQTLLLSGHVAIAADRYEEAEEVFLQFVQRNPAHLGARITLARLLERTQRYADALGTLEPVFATGANNPQLLDFKANLFLQLGRASEALPILEELYARAPNPSLSLKLANAYLQLNQNDKAQPLLERALKENPKDKIVNMSLGTILLKQGDPAGALEAAERLLNFAPESLNALDLKGAALVALDRPEDAQRVYLDALRGKPGHLTLSRSLANLHIKAGQLEAATQVLAAAVEAHPDDVAIHLDLAEVLDQLRLDDRVIATLQKAKTVAIKNIRPGLVLFYFYLDRSRLDEALTLVRELELVEENSLRILEARGRYEIASSSLLSARNTFSNMARIAGFQSEALRKIAGFQVQVEDIDSARYSLQKAVQGAPQDPRPLTDLVQLNLRSKRPDLAMARWESLNELLPEAPRTAVLLGDIHMANSAFDEAAKAYQRAVERASSLSNALVLKKFAALEQSGKTEAAETLLSGWIAEHKSDLLARMARASWYARRKLNPMAVTEFEAVLGLAPDDVTALNQLALLLFDADAEKATVYARRAYKLAPTRAAVLDTYGWLLVRQQRYPQGLKLLRAAEARAGGRPDIVYHIAVALDGVGRRQAGLRALKEALRSSETFSGRVEAEALLQRWNNRAAGKIPAFK